MTQCLKPSIKCLMLCIPENFETVPEFLKLTILNSWDLYNRLLSPILQLLVVVILQTSTKTLQCNVFGDHEN
jgi:hypothetical protein